MAARGEGAATQANTPHLTAKFKLTPMDRLLEDAHTDIQVFKSFAKLWLKT